MAPSHSKPESSASPPSSQGGFHAGINAALARGKALRKLEKSVRCGDLKYPRDTVLLPGINGNQYTLGMLMDDEGLPYEDAVDVMLKFRREFGVQSDPNPKAGPASLPESSNARKKSSGSKPASSVGAEDAPSPATSSLKKGKVEETGKEEMVEKSKKKRPSPKEDAQEEEKPSKATKASRKPVAEPETAAAAERPKRKAKVEDEPKEEPQEVEVASSGSRTKKNKKAQAAEEATEQPCNKSALKRLKPIENVEENGQGENPAGHDEEEHQGWADEGWGLQAGTEQGDVDEADMMLEYQLWREQRWQEDEAKRWSKLSREERYQEVLQQFAEEDPQQPTRRRVRFKQPPAHVVPEKAEEGVPEAADEEYSQDRQPDFLNGWCLGSAGMTEGL